MPRRLESLIVEAMESARWRGHKLTPFRRHAGRAYAECERCNAGVAVDIAPPPNGIDIGGSAVAVNCPKEVVNAT